MPQTYADGVPASCPASAHGRPRCQSRNSPGWPVARHIVECLQIHAELGSRPEGGCKEPRRVGCAAAPVVHDLVDAPHRNAHFGSEFCLWNAQFAKELITQDLTRMGCCSVARNHVCPPKWQSVMRSTFGTRRLCKDSLRHRLPLEHFPCEVRHTETHRIVVGVMAGIGQRAEGDFHAGAAR
jgi:hypothetical protein